MRTRLSSREILLEEDVLREERSKNMINIDILLDETIRKAESGTFTLTIIWDFKITFAILIFFQKNFYL